MRIHFPKRYWIYIAGIIVLAILLFVNIFVTNCLTESKMIRDFAKQDWLYFTVFLLIELALLLALCFFSYRAGKIYVKQQEESRNYYNNFRFEGIRPEARDSVWFSFEGNERARFDKLPEGYYLRIDRFNYKTESWYQTEAIRNLKSLKEIKETLFYEFDFFCEENAKKSKCKGVIFKNEP